MLSYKQISIDGGADIKLDLETGGSCVHACHLLPGVIKEPAARLLINKHSIYFFFLYSLMLIPVHTEKALRNEFSS